MKNTARYLLVMALVWTAMLLASTVSMVEYHERAHARIFYIFGYENITVHNYGIGGFVTANHTEYSQIENANDYNLLNEIVGYSFGALITSLWIMIMFILVAVVVYLEVVRSDSEN